MATISDIASWTIADENITGNVGDTNLTLVTTDFHAVATLEVSAPADFAVVDIGVVGLGNSGGGSGAVDSVNGKTGVVVLNQDDVLDGTTHKQYSATEKTKLAGIATGATANDTDANLKNRANHTGSQAISTVTGLQTALDGKQPLDSDLTAIAALAPTDNDFVQRKAGAWTNRTPAQAKTDLALTKSDVGLANVDNTSDANKPVSTATQTALDGKQPLDADLTAIAALAPADDAIIQRKSSAWASRTMAQLKTDLALTKSDVGLSNVDNTSDANKPISTAQQTAFDARFVWADGTTPSNARPSTSSKVIWVGGTTQPTNMATGDLWVKA
jgi:acid phosphatase family membrane protein YuiD